MPDLCKLMTSTFILFRSPSLLYQTANFLNWRLFKMKTAVTLLRAHVCNDWLSCIWLEWISGPLWNIDFRKKKSGFLVWLQDVFFEHWKYNWLHHWSMYNWTCREGLKLLVGVWMNHLYIQHIKKKKLREVMNSSVSLYRHTYSSLRIFVCKLFF